MNRHEFRAMVRWTGNQGSGTEDYRAYSRDHEISGEGKEAVIPGSADPAFQGDGARYSPEELLVASLAQCHMLFYLHLCADAHIVVTAYEDHAEGTMTVNQEGDGQFDEVLLRPRVTIANPARTTEALSMHDRAHALCYIARSVNFQVRHRPVIHAD